MSQEINDCLWAPSKERVSTTEMTRFLTQVNRQFGLKHTGYDSLHHWSISNKEDFWSSLWDFFDLAGNKGDAIVENADQMPGASWFPNAQLNFAENLLRHADSSPTAIALVERGEHGRRHALNYQELRKQVARVAAHLKSEGVNKGDVVAGFLPNGHHAIVAMLATASLGAIWTSCSPDFGTAGVLDRLSQTQPKVLFACDGYYYGNKCINSRDRVEEISQQLAQLKSLVIIPYLNEGDAVEATSLKVSPNVSSSFWQDIISAETDYQLIFEAMNFSDPLYVMYSSGTTGKPKCIVHSVGGTLLQHVKELGLHTDVKPGTRLFYYTTCGWMMWNWLASGLAMGATIILFDGSPFHPSKSVLFDIADEEQVNFFGASAKFYAACEKYRLKPKKSHSLSNVRCFLSTGSPLSHESFEYLYSDVKEDVCVSSISGGTDIISCFALGNPNLPVYKGELQCLGLGMDVHFVDDNGVALTNGKGELVCRQSFPSMPTGFWKDPEDQKYKQAYFARFSNTWAHGDYGEIVKHSSHSGYPEQTGVIIHGRSDAVLNPGGVRIGTSEIYRQVEKIEQVFESIAIGQEWQDDVRVVLFVRLQDGLELDEPLIQEIKQSIRQNTTPRHVPSKIIQVADIPRTLSGKIVELAVRNVVHGRAVSNTEALANPQALKLFSGLEALASE